MSKVSILLVSDNPGNLESMLDGMDVKLVRAASVEPTLVSGEFAAVVLDEPFPSAERVESIQSQTPIILLIAPENINVLHEYTADYLLKPVVPQMMRSKIALYVDLFNKTQEINQLRQQSFDQPNNAAQRRMDFLVRVSAVLGSSLDYETTLANVARLAVPTIADWCAVDILDEDGLIRRLAVAHKDPAKVAWIYELQKRYPPDPSAPGGTYQILRTGQPTYIPHLTDEMLVASARDEEHLRIARELGFVSAMSVPLVARGRTLGVLTLTSNESGHHYDEDDLEFAIELANRAGLAVDNARLYREATKQREYLQVTLSSIGDAVIATDAQGCVTFMNPVAESLTGWSQDAAMGKQLTQVFDIVNEITRVAVETPVAKVIRHGSIVGLANHTVLLSKDGREIPIDDSGAPIRDSEGNIVGVILVFRDITERKADENALVESEQRFRTMADTTPVLIWQSDVDGISNYFNKPWLDFTGRTLAEELNNGWTEGVHPEDYERCRDLFRASIKARQPFQMEYRLRHHNGEYHWMIDQGVPRFAPDGTFTGFIGACTDINERKNAESALEHAIDYHRRLEDQFALLVGVSTDLLSTLSLDAILETVLNVSSQIIPSDAYAVWRFISPGEGWRVIASKGLSEEYKANFLKSNTNAPPFDKPVAIEDVDHEDFSNPRRESYLAEGIRSLLITPLHVRGQRAGTIVFYNHQPRHFDEIEIRIAMAHANIVAAAIGSAELYAEAEQALALRNEFLSIAAHELKTPVTSLRGYAQAITRRMDKQGELDVENTRKALATIDQQSMRLTRLIERLLDISRIEAGRFALDQDSVDLIQIVQDVVLLRRTTTHHEITLTAPDTLTLRCDPLRIEQVLTNLLDNAIKFSPDGGTVSIEVSAGNSVRVAVTDNGMGIPPEKREHLFKQFYQAHAPGFLGGLGLGLYISHEIIRLHGGTLYAEYPVEGGTRFVFTLPG